MNDYIPISKMSFEPTMWSSSHSSPSQAWSGSESSGDTSNYDAIFNDWDFTIGNTALLQTVNTNMAYPDMPAMNLQLSNTSFTSTPSSYDTLDQPRQSIERTISPPSRPMTCDKTCSNRTEQRRERRRIQNRNSQRQYRARKEGLLKDYSQRITELENEVKQYQSANNDLTKIIQSMRRDRDSSDSSMMTRCARPT